MDTQTKFKTTIAFAMPMLCALPAAYTAFTIRDTNAKIRFTTGFISTERMHSNSWLYYHTIYHLIMSSSHTGFFGGTEYYAKHNIKSVKQALIASICPGQVYFIDKQDKTSKSVQQRCMSLLKETAEIVACSVATKIVCNIIQRYDLMDTITSSPLFHMEILALLKSLSNPSRNLPAIILGFLFCNQLEVHVPYSFTYFLPSPRVFWKNWSKPAGEMYKYLLYKPLGGRNNAILATM
eukprot:23770_1